MNTKPLVAAALAATALAACGHPAAPTASKAPAPAVAAKTTIKKPGEVKPEAGKTGFWSGTVAGKPAHVMLNGSLVRATFGTSELNASVWPSLVTGGLRVDGGGQPNVSLNFVAGDMSGFIGNTPCRATFLGSGWLTGSAGSKQMNLTVHGGSVVGDVAGRPVFLSGPGLGAGDGPGLEAAMLAALYLAE